MNDISGLGNQFQTDTYQTSANGLKDKIDNTDYSKASDEELMDACKSFEEYFVEQAFKGMEKMIPEDKDKKSSDTSYADMFKDKLYQEYATKATDRGDGLGIATKLYEQMKRNYDL